VGLGDIMNFTMIAVIGSLVVTVGVTVLILGVVVWAVRRATPPAEDPAIAELKRRLAAGEISPVEYEVRLRALQEEA
jgi:uncharacterized membrane protein